MTYPINKSLKRRIQDDEPIVLNDCKRYFDSNTVFSPIEMPKEKDLPSITYASPDYRPPPPTKQPLWLQPVTISAEDDSEDDTPLLTPVQKNTNGYWEEDMVIENE